MSRWKTLAGIVALMALTLPDSGCGIFRKYWYQSVPVDNALGDSTTALAGKPMHVHRDNGIEVYAASASAVNVGWDQLKFAVRGYERLFGQRAPSVALVLTDDASAVSAADSAAMRAAGMAVITYHRPAEVRSLSARLQKYSRDDLDELWPAGAQISRVLVAHWIRMRSVGSLDGVRESELLDRLPAWYRDALTGLLSDPAGAEDALIAAQEERGAMIPLTELLARSRPAVQDTIAPHGKRDREQVLRNEAVTFGLFLAERGGSRMVGELGDALLAGKSAEPFFAQEKRLPHTMDEMERVWREWLKERSR